MLRATRIAICLAIGFSPVVCARPGLGQVTLKHKFHEGTSQLAETSARIEQKLTIAGMEIDTASNTRSTVKATTGTRDVEGKLRVQEKIESLQISVTVMGQNYTFDSANPDNKGSSPLEVLRDFHKAIARRTTTVVFDKSDRACAIETDDDVGSLPAELQTLVKSQLDPENLKNTANEELDQIKSEPVNKGDTWERLKTANFGAGQVMDFKTLFTYEGTIERDGKTLDKITSKVLSITFALDKSPLPFTLKSSDLKAAESQGVILFDRQRGETVESTSNIRVTGDIVFVANNMDLPAKLDLKMERATTVKP